MRGTEDRLTLSRPRKLTVRKQLLPTAGWLLCSQSLHNTISCAPAWPSPRALAPAPPHSAGPRCAPPDGARPRARLLRRRPRPPPHQQSVPPPQPHPAPHAQRHPRHRWVPRQPRPCAACRACPRTALRCHRRCSLPHRARPPAACRPCGAPWRPELRWQGRHAQGRQHCRQRYLRPTQELDLNQSSHSPCSNEKTHWVHTGVSALGGLCRGSAGLARPALASTRCLEAGHAGPAAGPVRMAQEPVVSAHAELCVWHAAGRSTQADQSTMLFARECLCRTGSDYG